LRRTAKEVEAAPKQTPKQVIAAAKTEAASIEAMSKHVNIESLHMPPRHTDDLVKKSDLKPEKKRSKENDCPNQEKLKPTVTLAPQTSDASKKSQYGRVHDWLCLSCKNLNFSFRDSCNRCSMSRTSFGQTITNEQQLATFNQRLDTDDKSDTANSWVSSKSF
jgi:hypothetical protein